jgi:DnaJ-class molecular chaperone
MDVDTFVLEEKCEQCDGTGAQYRSRCSACEGKRLVPTELGEGVLNLVRRNLGLPD